MTRQIPAGEWMPIPPQSLRYRMGRDAVMVRATTPGFSMLSPGGNTTTSRKEIRYCNHEETLP